VSISKAYEVRPVIIFDKKQLGARLEHMIEELSLFSKFINKIGSDNNRSVNFMFLNFDKKDVESIIGCIELALDRYK
jgi:hypothetical protein